MSLYEFVKAMFDNKDALTEGHAKFGFLDPESASAGATVTMHPGAEKYYKENRRPVSRIATVY